MSKEQLAPLFTQANAWAIVFVIWSAFMLLLTSGWIEIPAKRTELESVSRQLEALKQESKETREAIARLEGSLSELRRSLSPTKPTSIPILKQHADKNEDDNAHSHN